MKIALFGASGGTGHEIIKQAIENGHKVTAFVRNPKKIILNYKNLRLIKGDVKNQNAVNKAVAGQDVVMSCLGVKPGQNPICELGTKKIISSMKKGKVKRLIVESAYGVGKTKNKGIYAKVLNGLVNRLVEDKERMEKTIMQSSLEWTIVQPTILTNGPKTKDYRYGEDILVKGFEKVSRASVAEFMLRCAEGKNMVKKNIIITSLI